MLKEKQEEIMKERQQLEEIEESRRKLEANRRKQNFGWVVSFVP